MQKKTHNGRNYTGERNIKAVCPVNLTTAHIKRKVRSSIQERPARSKTTHDIPLRSIYQRLSWYERYHRYSVTFRDIRRVSLKARIHRASLQSVAIELGEIAWQRPRVCNMHMCPSSYFKSKIEWVKCLFFRDIKWMSFEARIRRASPQSVAAELGKITWQRQRV